MGMYVCSMFHIFYRPILEKYVSQVEGESHFFQLCLCVAQDSLLLVVKKMHLSFESLGVTNTLNLQVFLIDIHYDTSFKFILEDDFISLTFGARIRSCLGKEVGLWLIVKHLSIHSLHILLSL
jgi:hypothetical protein